jgi:hypothetical protein
MSERQEFVEFAQREGAKVTALCHGFKFSRKTRYKRPRAGSEGPDSISREWGSLDPPNRRPCDRTLTWKARTDCCMYARE